jgi:hypothetical protein
VSLTAGDASADAMTLSGCPTMEAVIDGTIDP